MDQFKQKAIQNSIKEHIQHFKIRKETELYSYLDVYQIYFIYGQKEVQFENYTKNGEEWSAHEIVEYVKKHIELIDRGNFKGTLKQTGLIEDVKQV